MRRRRLRHRKVVRVSDAPENLSILYFRKRSLDIPHDIFDVRDEGVYEEDDSSLGRCASPSVLIDRVWRHISKLSLLDKQWIHFTKGCFLRTGIRPDVKS